MRSKVYILMVCWLAGSLLHAVEVSPAVTFLPDTTGVKMTQAVDTLPAHRIKASFQPDPDMAIWLAAVVPGLGQIYNRQYWKLPIVYGGAMGLAYAVSWNNMMYTDYRKAYIDLIDNNPNSKFYEKVLPAGVVIDSSNKDYYTRVIKNKQDSYQSNRDLTIICCAVLYLLTLVDAYVDAQMADFDITPDLSMQIAPSIMAPSQQQQMDAAVGLSCKFNF